MKTCILFTFYLISEELSETDMEVNDDVVILYRLVFLLFLIKSCEQSQPLKTLLPSDKFQYPLKISENC